MSVRKLSWGGQTIGKSCNIQNSFSFISMLSRSEKSKTFSKNIFANLWQSSIKIKMKILQLALSSRFFFFRSSEKFWKNVQKIPTKEINLINIFYKRIQLLSFFFFFSFNFFSLFFYFLIFRFYYRHHIDSCWLRLLSGEPRMLQRISGTNSLHSKSKRKRNKKKWKEEMETESERER